MNAQAEGSDGREQDESSRHPTPDRLVDEQHQVFPDDESIELALAGQPRAKLVWDFGEAERCRRRREQIEEDLESLTRQAAHRALECRAPDHEVPAHRVA